MGAASRFFAVDWSGDQRSAAARRLIWLAEARDGALLRLESGRDRDEVAEHLISESECDPSFVVGLDFAFSLPAWFLEERGLNEARELWRLAAREGERWLSECATPFWGRPGRPRPDLGGRAHRRRTDREVPAVAGTRPKSPFQIGGAGAVGTGTIRGLPILLRLSEAGFAVWPFDEPRLPLVIEIYPRLLTGAVVKSRRAERAWLLTARHPGLSAEHRARVVDSDDALDAGLSALAMWEARDALHRLTRTDDSTERREGRIWHPPVDQLGLEDPRPSRPRARLTSGDDTPLGHRFDRAVQLAREWHAGQTRKGTQIPYLAHLLSVSALVLEASGDEDQAIAGLLHDALEDSGTMDAYHARVARIEEEFGREVLAMVEGCTDGTPDEKRDMEWEERKARYVRHLREDVSERRLLVSLADKLHNARALRYDYRRMGEALWERFNRPTLALPYYRSLADVFTDRLDPETPPGRLARELDRVVSDLEAAVEATH